MISGLFKRIARMAGYRLIKPKGIGRNLRAKFDAAQTTDENRRHWINADNLSPDAAADPEIRRILRMRGRYEQHSNPYMDGMLQTLAADVVGDGPRLQMRTGDKRADAFIETEFGEWCEETNFAAKLRQLVETRAAAGEVFGLRANNLGLPTPVKFDLRLYEGDQVASPFLSTWPDDERYVDGIVYDKYGNPAFYYLLRQHPGDTRFINGTIEYDVVPAQDMIHFYLGRRPGQRRGVPQIASSLPITADRRQFRQSVVMAALVAAQLGAVTLETDTPGNEEEEYDPFDTLEIERGMMTTLPNGYKAKQLDPKQPATTYSEFDDKLINEGARPLNMPFNVAACDSSKYNYASGRLDHQTYDRANETVRGDLRRIVLRRVLRWWLADAVRIPGYMPSSTRQLVHRVIPHSWLWRGRGHVDPLKEAKSQQAQIESYVTTLEDEWAKNGLDPESQWDKIKRQVERLREIEDINAAFDDMPDGDDDDVELSSLGGRLGNNGNGNGSLDHE